MKDIADQEVIDLDDMDVEAFNEFATEQGWSDGMPLFVPTESKVAKFVDTVRGDNRPYAPVPPRQVIPTCRPRRQRRDGRMPPRTTFRWFCRRCAACWSPTTTCTAR